ncbi:MAG: heavy metal translocating P-type ATPase [Planctomycetota bacterium]|jgi:heavy metal translocating P-type ATPase
MSATQDPAAEGPAAEGPHCLPEGYETPLTEEEQQHIRAELLPLLFGAGLLVLGQVYRWLQPDQAEVATIMEAVAALTVGLPIFRHAWTGFLAKPTHSVTEQLVSIAILAAMATGDFVTATLVPLFMELGHLFEERSSRGARAAIDGIRSLHASRATQVDGDGNETEVDPASLKAGDEVLVRPGEVIPVDGEVTSGRSSVDQAPITGESHYEEVGPGSQVYSGTVNLDGLLRLRTVQTGGQTVLGRVLKLLQEVERSKNPIIRLLERYATVYLPLVLAIAAVTLFATADLERAIAILIVSCPCALVLAGPAAMVASMTAATRLGVLIKSAGFLEAATEIRTLVLDKTGTVTSGSLTVTDVAVVGSDTETDDVLLAAARCGTGSLHPVSRAAVERARAQGLAVPESEAITEVPGEGVRAVGQGGTFRLGRLTWLAAEGVSVAGVDDRPAPGAWVARDGVLLGYLALEDRPRREAREALDELRSLGVERLILLTGDRESAAVKVADELGFDQVVAEVLPQEKLDLVRKEQEQGPVMMVGDGVNDALALSGADVGVAIGARVSEVALGGADVAVASGDLSRLPKLLRLADATRWTIVLNALLGTGFSLAMIGLAAVGLISPLLGAFLHNAGSLVVIANSSRLVGLFDREQRRGPYLGPELQGAEPRAAAA